MTSADVDFDEFVRTSGDRLRRVLVAQHGVDDGCDLAADALSHAWQHWDRVATMDNAVGYLYRVAQSASLSTVRNHVHRGLRRLRSIMEDTT